MKQSPKNKLLFEKLEDRIYLSAVPTATITVPAESFVNEEIAGISINFDNTDATSVGYGPYMDVLFDPDYDTTGVAATYMGSSVSSVTRITYNGSGVPSVATHPLTEESISTDLTRANHSLVFVELPLGSFTPSQPVAKIDFTGIAFPNSFDTNLLSTNQPIKVIPGFRFGNDPQHNPGSDPAIKGSSTTGNIKPSIYTITKTTSAPESETATGPNYPFDYVLTVDIANGKTLSNLDLTDTFHDGFVATNVAIVGSNGINTQNPGGTPFGPGTNLVIDFDGEVGSAGPNDITVTITGHFDKHFADTVTDVVPEATGITQVYNNAVSTTGTYLGVNYGKPDNINVNAKSIATQTGVSVVGGGDAIPGATLEFTVNFQVSDYFSFKDVILKDTLEDGLDFDTGFAPTLAVHENGVDTNRSIDVGNQSDTINGYVTDLVFNISDDLVTAGQDGILDGDLYSGDVTLTAGTTGTVVYRATIGEEYREVAKGSVNIGDILSNSVTLESNLSYGGFDAVSDTTSATVTVPGAAVTKTLFAIDGVTPTGSDISLDSLVGYKISLTLDSADTGTLVFTDFLPLPIFDASNINSGTSPYDLVPTQTVPTEASLGAGDLVVVASTNVVSGLSGGGGTPAGQVKVTTDTAANTIKVELFDISVSGSGQEVIDIYFALNAQSQPMPSGLKHTNLIQVEYANTAATTFTQSSINQLSVLTPEPRISSAFVSMGAGVGTINGSTGPSGVTWNAPGAATPFSGTLSTYDADNTKNIANNALASTLKDADAGDVTRVAVVVENRGGADVFDLLIKETIPSGHIEYSGPGGYNFLMSTGDGTLLAYSDFEDSVGSTLNNKGEFATAFFDPGNGVRLKNAANLIAETAAQTGVNNDNVLVITYDIELEDANTNPKDTKTSTSSIEGFSSSAGGANWVGTYTDVHWQDDVNATTGTPSLVRSIINTSVNADTSSSVVIGEVITHRLEVTIPEGVLKDLQIIETIPAGMKLYNAAEGGVDPTVDTATPGFTGTVNGFAFLPSGATADGEDITFDFGQIEVTGNNITGDNTFYIEYQVLVLNVAGNQNSTVLTNTATLSYDDPTSGSTDLNLSIAGVNKGITIEEAQLNIAKTVIVNGSGTTGDAGDSVQYTLVISHLSGSEAFDTSLVDNFPSDISGLTLTSATHNIDGDISGSFEAIASNTLTLLESKNINVKSGETATIVLTGTLTATVEAGETLSSNSDIKWTSTPGANVNERNGSGGINDYTDYDGATITISSPVVDKATPSPTSYAIGSPIAYSVTVAVPEGVTSNMVFKDELEFGLQFLSNSVTVTRSGIDLTTTVGATDFTDIITGTLSNSDRTLSIDLGTVTNANTANGAAETLIITYTAFLTNDADSNNVKDSVRGNTRANVATLGSLNHTCPSCPTDNKSVTVIEPLLKVTKTVSVTTPEAGDPIVYTITIAHDTASDADAFDLGLSDVFPAEIVNFVTPITVISGPAVAGDFDISGNTLSIIGDVDLPLGQSIVIEVSASINQTAEAKQSIDNNATVTWTSVDGTPAQGERTGSLTPPTVNDYSDTTDTPANFVMNGLVGIKSIVSSSEASTNATPGPDEEMAIGETIRYRLVTTIPQSSTDNLQIQDKIPSGMQYVNGSAKIAFLSNEGGLSSTASGAIPGLSGAGLDVNGSDPSVVTPTFVIPDLNVSTSASPATNDDTYNAGTDVFFRLGDVDNANLDADLEYIIIEFDALVLDIPGNTQGLQQYNVYEIFIDGVSDSLSTSALGKIVFPELVLAKTTISPTPAEVQLGDVVRYQVTLDHAGGSLAAARDVSFIDTLPDTKLEIDPDSITIAGTNSITGGTFVVSGANNNIIQSSSDFSLLLGENLILTYDATVTVNNAMGDVVTNSVSVDYDSIDGANPNQGSFNETTNEPINLFGVDLQLTKTNPDEGLDLAPGSSTTYTLTLTNLNVADSTTASSITVVETLPIGLSYNAASIEPDSVVGNVITWTFTDLAKGTSQVFTLTADVDSPALSGIETAVNNAVASLNLPHIEENTSNNADSLSVNISATPDLSITKSSGLSDSIPGQAVTYTITITNNGAQESGLVSVSDTFPDNALDFISADNSGVFSSPTITWSDLPSIAGNGGTKILTVQAVVKNPVASLIVDFSNSITVSEDSGEESSNGLLSDNSAMEVVTVTATPDYKAEITDGLGFILSGNRATYTITVSNLGDQVGDNVDVVLTFPADSLSNFSEITDNPGGGINFISIDPAVGPKTGEITWRIDSVTPGTPVTLKASAVVNGTPGTVLINSVTVSDDDANGADPGNTNNTAIDSTTIQSPYSYDFINNFNPQIKVKPESEVQIAYKKVTPSMFPSSAASPTYTGKAPPGSTIGVELYSGSGELIGSKISTTDSGGNWITNFPSTQHANDIVTVNVRQITVSQEANNTRGQEVKIYYFSTPNGCICLAKTLSVKSVIKGASEKATIIQKEFNENPEFLESYADPFEDLEIDKKLFKV